MDRNEVEIVEILAADGAVVVKGNSPQGKYVIPIVYRLVTGELIEAHDYFRLQRDAKAELAKLPHAPKHPMKANFMNGEFWGTSTSYYIGPRREAVDA